MSSSVTRRNDLDALHPVVRQAVQRVLEKLKAENIPFEFFETYRTPERQSILFAQGRTAPGDIVTKAKPWTSYHQYGLAVDFVLRIDGQWSWSSAGERRNWWVRLHEIGRENNLEPLSWELPHLQYSGTTISALQAGDYPELGDDAWAENLSDTISNWSGAEAAPPPPIGYTARPAIKTRPRSETATEPNYGSVTTEASDPIVEHPEIGLTAAVITAAQASDRIWGVPASVTLAQFILESAGGKRMPSGSNNPFGIKARDGEPYVEARTGETIRGQKVTITAKFRKFANFDEAFSQHGRLLATSSYYKKAMAVKDDPIAFANALTGVYATDPEYGKQLGRLIGQYDLKQYDIDIAPSSSPSAVTVNSPIPSTSTNEIGMGAQGENVRALQLALKSAGYSVGAVDGIFGTLTRGALLAFQADNKLPTTGNATAGTLALLNTPPRRPLSRERLTASEKDLSDAGSQTILQAKRTKLLGVISSALGALGIGNSAIVNMDPAIPAQPVDAQFATFLTQLQSVLPDAISKIDISKLQPLLDKANALKASLASHQAPDLVKLATEFRQVIPPDLLAKNPGLEQFLNSLNSEALQAPVRTVFDLLANTVQPGNAHGVLEVVASIASSVIPGFGGSLVTLGVGLLAHFLGSQISKARVQEHQDGSNLSK